MASVSAPGFIQDEADIVLLDASLHSFTRILNRCRHTITNVGNVIQGAFTDNLAVLLLAAIGAGLFAWRHIPLAITPLMALAVLVLLQPLLASALDTDTLDARPSSTSLDSRPSQVFLALIAALLGLGGFLTFFALQGLSPNYIDSASELYLQATTVVVASLALFQWINLLFIRANHTKSLASPKLWRNHNVFWTLAISLLVLGNVIYNPIMQNFLGTQALGLDDWLIVITLAILYGAIRWFVRSERKHSRRAIVELHQAVHGTRAEPKI
jgi:magnesium-transporting ATPase (P-type)